MSNRTYELFLFDIYIAIIKINIVASKFDNSEELLNDFVSWDSVIREFEIIGEASNILLTEGIIDKKYRIVVDFRNKIIHHYFGIDASGVWNIITDDLHVYKEHIKKKIKEIDKTLFLILIETVIKDNQKYSIVIEKIQQLKDM